MLYLKAKMRNTNSISTWFTSKWS